MLEVTLTKEYVFESKDGTRKPGCEAHFENLCNRSNCKVIMSTDRKMVYGVWS